MLPVDDKHCVLVPFVVLQELDKLKTNKDISRLAATAILFINNQLQQGNNRFQGKLENKKKLFISFSFPALPNSIIFDDCLGQKASEDTQHMIDIRGADDRILNCCLQLKQHSSDVILVSNDINLRNKSLASGIWAINSSEYLLKYEKHWK